MSIEFLIKLQLGWLKWVFIGHQIVYRMQYRHVSICDVSKSIVTILPMFIWISSVPSESIQLILNKSCMQTLVSFQCKVCKIFSEWKSAPECRMTSFRWNDIERPYICNREPVLIHIAFYWIFHRVSMKYYGSHTTFIQYLLNRFTSKTNTVEAKKT